MKATNESIDMGHSTLFKRPDGIIQITAKNHTYSVNELEHAIGVMKKVCEDQKYPFLFVAQENSMFDSAALKYFSTPNLLSFSGARAYLLKSRTQKILAHVFLSLSANKTPCKAFMDETGAIAWLKKINQ